MEHELTPKPQLSSQDPERFLATSHLHGALKERSIRGGTVILFSQAAKFFVSTAGTVVLARLLAPSDFGLVGMVAALTGVIATLGDLGLSSATIQRKDLTHDQVSTLFWINAGIGTAMTCVVAACGPVIASFYREPRLVGITLVSSLSFLLGGLASQHYALLTRQMRFTAMALVQSGSALLAMIVAVALALRGFGYWSLVVSGVLQAAGLALFSWISIGWKPGLPRKGCGVRSLLAFGGHLTGYNLLTYVTRNTDNVLIGRFLGAAPLGIYSKAYGILMLPVQQINAPVNGVLLPALSRLQDQPEAYRRYFLRAIEIVALIGMPIVIFAFADAQLVVLTLLGAKWMGAVRIFRLLAPAAAVGTISMAPVWIFTSLGKAERQSRWAVISSPVILGGFIVGLHWGVAGVAASFSITYSLTFLLFLVDATRRSPIHLRDVALSLAPALTASAAGAAAIVGLGAIPVTGWLAHLSHPARLGVDCLLFTLAFLPVSQLFPAGRKVWSMLPDMLQKRRA